MDEDIEAFYSDLNKAVKECTIIMGNFNAKVGTLKDNSVNGGYCLGERNEIGDILIEWAGIHDMVVGNTWFQSKTSMDDGKAQIISPKKKKKKKKFKLTTY